MKQKIPSLLRLAALLDGLLLSYPVLAILELSLLGRLEAASSLLRLGIVLAGGALGGLVGWLLDRLKNPPVRAVVFLLAAAPAVAFCGTLLFLLEGTVFHWALATLCAVFYLLGIFFATQPFDGIIGTSFLSFAMVAYVLAAVIVWFCSAYFHMPCDSVPLIALFLFFILLYAILSNQSNIDRLMGRRHYDLSMLPAGMRRYNLLLICAGFVLVLLGLLFQRQILAVVQFGIRVAGSLLYIFVLLFQFITWMLNRPADPDRPLPKVDAAPVFGTAEESATTPFVNAVFQWAAVLLILLLLFSGRRQIWSACKKTASFIWRIFRKLFTRTDGQPGPRTADSVYFSDILEDLERIPEEKPSAGEGVSSLRVWRRRCLAFLGKPAHTASLREGYALILAWLRIHGAPLLPADTTLEILNKALARMPESPFSQVTESYNNIRYGEMPLREGDYESLQQTLRLLIQTK
ncbi:MAG: DUF4129 domain-containing protein [Oscillospiraceae bacterium]|nr:DUF4129 domain-containing protein [Oscillospiraceae bacterium]